MEAKKAYKTFQYRGTVVWQGGRRGRASAPGLPDLEVGSPPEFKGGQEGVWAPEHLLVASLNTCLMLTFLSLAERRSMAVAGYDSSAEGLLEHADGRYRITSVTVRPRIAVNAEADLAAAQAIMGKVEENCFISNSITSKINLQPEFFIVQNG
ncbi:MAG TPA: OsmC family protein [Terriglobia bacterium]|nr:OsmC family protein [Terriglobia bacterium]